MIRARVQSLACDLPIGEAASDDFMKSLGPRLGSGAFGDVYATRSGDKVVKLSVWDDKTSRIEAALYKLCSDHDIGPTYMSATKIRRVGEWPRLAIRMEKFDMDLDRFSRTSPPPTHLELTRVEGQIRRCLYALAELGVVCLDQRPVNILVKGRGNALRAVLTDFDYEFCCALPGESGTGRSNPCMLKACTSKSAHAVVPLLLLQVRRQMMDRGWSMFAADAADTKKLTQSDDAFEGIDMDALDSSVDPKTKELLQRARDEMDPRRALKDVDSNFRYYTGASPPGARRLKRKAEDHVARASKASSSPSRSSSPPSSPSRGSSVWNS